jgi:hypothetical protein
MRELSIGTLSVTVSDEHFMQGYQAGSTRYQQVYHKSALSERGVYAILMQRITDSTKQDRYNAGFITGWYAALFSQENQAAMVPSDTTSILYDLGQHTLDTDETYKLFLALKELF